MRCFKSSDLYRLGTQAAPAGIHSAQHKEAGDEQWGMYVGDVVA